MSYILRATIGIQSPSFSNDDFDSRIGSAALTRTTMQLRTDERKAAGAGGAASPSPAAAEGRPGQFLGRAQSRAGDEAGSGMDPEASEVSDPFSEQNACCTAGGTTLVDSAPPGRRSSAAAPLAAAFLAVSSRSQRQNQPQLISLFWAHADESVAGQQSQGQGRERTP